MNAPVCTMLIALFSVAACDSGPSDEEREEAERIWEVSNSELHAMHGETVRTDPPLLAEYTYQCPEGGSIDMVVTYEGEAIRANIDDLVHVYNDCETGGLVLNGTLDYLGFSFCENGAPSFEVAGDLVVTGDLITECELSGTETCGSLVGTSCGVTVR